MPLLTLPYSEKLLMLQGRCCRAAGVAFTCRSWGDRSVFTVALNSRAGRLALM